MAPQGDLREILLNTPALLAPQGVEPNFVDPPTIRPQMLGVIISMLLLSTLAVAVRVYTKFVVIKRLALEDHLIVSAWLLYAAGYQTINYIMVNMKGTGDHQWNVKPRDLIRFLYYLQIANTLYGLVIVQIKAAVIVQSLRVLVPTGIRTATYWILHILLCAHIIFYVVTTFIEIFMCSPRSKAWDPTVLEGHCMNSKAVNISAGTINTASDLILVVIPQIIIWRLNMSVQKKWALSLVFLVGVLACTSAAVRMYYSIELTQDKEFTWVSTKMGMWVPVEMCCGFLVACMPVFPRFFKHEPVFSTIGSSLWLLIRLRSSASAKYSSERLGSSDASKQKKEPVVTDIEFDELVRRTDLSMVSVDRFDPDK